MYYQLYHLSIQSLPYHPPLPSFPTRRSSDLIRPIRTMMNHSTSELFFDDLEVPAENLIGEEGRGFRYILSGMNAERIDRKSTRLNSSHVAISYAVFCLKKKK